MPSLSAFNTRVYWAPADHTWTVLLVPAPSALPCGTNLFHVLDGVAGETDSLGVHIHYELGNGDRLQLLCVATTALDQPLAALVPLDGDGPDRLEAIDRLLRALLGRKIPQDTRLTVQQRRRSRHMLQAIDGRMNGASYRDIATAIFGSDRGTIIRGRLPRCATSPWTWSRTPSP